MKIKSIKTEYYSGPVYNLGIQENHNYVAEGILVTNCYTSALKTGINFDKVPEKIQELYGKLDPNNKPYQVAIGGAGEPTMHPQFEEILSTFKECDILPNITTNAMHFNESTVDAIKKHCGGVAISCHPHLDKIWRKGVKTLVEEKVLTNLHVIVGEPGSTDRLKQIIDTTEGIYSYVVLPYQVAGRAKDLETKPEWDKLFDWLIKTKPKNISFGALFDDYFTQRPEVIKELDISTFNHECFSGYIMFDDTYKLTRKSSYDLSPR